MPIKVKHAASPSVVLGASFGAGKELDRKRTAEDARRVAEARRARDESREFEEKMLGRKESFQRETTGEARDFQREQVESERRFDIKRDEYRSELRRDEYDYTLSAQQRADQERYQNALYEIEQSDAFTDEEKEEAKRRITAKLAGIRPIPSLKEPSKYPEGQGEGQVWRDGGYVYTRDKGVIKKLGEDRSQMTHKDFSAMVKDIRERLTTETDGLMKMPSTEEMRKAIEQELELRREFMPGMAGEEEEEKPEPWLELSDWSDEELNTELARRGIAEGISEAKRDAMGSMEYERARELLQERARRGKLRMQGVDRKATPSGSDEYQSLFSDLLKG